MPAPRRCGCRQIVVPANEKPREIAVAVACRKDDNVFRHIVCGPKDGLRTAGEVSRAGAERLAGGAWRDANQGVQSLFRYNHTALCADDGIPNSPIYHI